MFVFFQQKPVNDAPCTKETPCPADASVASAGAFGAGLTAGLITSHVLNLITRRFQFEQQWVSRMINDHYILQHNSYHKKNTCTSKKKKNWLSSLGCTR